jgi:hypothetical protein
MCDKSEDPVPNALFSMRYKLGALIAFNFPPLQQEGNLFVLFNKETASAAKFYRKFTNARLKAIDKFTEQFKSEYENDIEVICNVVL